MIQEQGSIYKTFARYVSLNMLSMLGLSLYILADTYFIASGVGSVGVAALNIALPVYGVINGTGLMLGMGGATKFAILRSAGEEAEANSCFSGIFRLGIFLSVAFMVLGGVFTTHIAELLGADSATAPLTISYLHTIFMFSGPFLCNQIFICFIRNDGGPSLSMRAMLLGSLSNILLDYLFIFPLGWGMFGAAFATGLAPVISMIVLSSHYKKRRHHFHFTKNLPSLQKNMKALSLGLPAFITELSSGMVILLFNLIILRISGNLALAAYGVVANLALVVTGLFTGLAQGIQPIVSESFGKGAFFSLRKVRNCALYLAGAMGVLFFLLGLFAADSVTAAFNHEQNAQFASIAIEGIRIYFAAFLFMGFNIVTASFLAATAMPLPSFFISMIRGFAAVLPFAFILSALLGMQGVWLTIPAAEAFTLLVSMTLLRRARRRLPE